MLRIKTTCVAVRHGRSQADDGDCTDPARAFSYRSVHGPAVDVACRSLALSTWGRPRRGWSTPRGGPVRLDRVHPSLAAQLKWTIATRCLQRTWRAQNLRAIRTIVKRIVGFLRADARQVTSVLDRNLDEWQLHLRSYLIASGAYRPETHSHLTRFALGEVKQYQREDPTIRVFRLLCAMVVEELDPRQGCAVVS